ncbi:MAG: hypothetical protein H0X45_12810 [Planctomycetes bacterium]|nr:hypothetical protein [Planctomycetota bacterium]
MNGDASILRLVLATGALMAGPVIGAIVLGGIQHGVYRLLRSEPPVFPILLLRGLMGMLALIAITVFYLKFGLGQPSMPPPAP